MQYLLTEEEMEAIRQERSDAAKVPNLLALTNVCQHLACNAIDLNPPNGRPEMTRPHGCIHVKPAGDGYQIRYCDFCPVQGICPQPKSWSK